MSTAWRARRRVPARLRSVSRGAPPVRRTAAEPPAACRVPPGPRQRDAFSWHWPELRQRARSRCCPRRRRRAIRRYELDSRPEAPRRAARRRFAESPRSGSMRTHARAAPARSQSSTSRQSACTSPAPSSSRSCVAAGDDGASPSAKRSVGVAARGHRRLFAAGSTRARSRPR